MRDLNVEYGDQYRVGQLLPHHAIALRERARAHTVVVKVNRDLGLRARPEQGFDSLRVSALLEVEDPRVAVNRERIFPRITR